MIERGTLATARLTAAVVDTFGALLASLVPAISLSEFSEPLAGTLFCVTFLLYFLVFEGFSGTTPGKWFQGLRVVDADGERAGWSAACIRTFARVVEVNPALFGGLPAGVTIFLTRSNQRIGDLVAGTFVVSDDDLTDARATPPPAESMVECSDCGELRPAVDREPCPVCGSQSPAHVDRPKEAM